MPVKDSNPDFSSSESSSYSYDPHEIERRWQAHWLAEGINRTPEAPLKSQEVFYALSMFPYPSGSLHMGHVRNYVITDVIARLKRMQGFVVLHPMGWDAFGLPAENAAIERGIDPGAWTRKNIIQMKEQLNRLGLSIDWKREQTTCDNNYYKWTQYLFLELYDAELAYQKKSSVNWDPIDKTVLANEQVDSEGRSWRSGAKVEKRDLTQWFLKITNYAEELLEDLNELKEWPERVCTMQSNWIGKSSGTEIDFLIDGKTNKKLTVFTTRPDTLFGASYIALSPEHDLVDQIMSKNKSSEIKDFRDKVNNLSTIERVDEKRQKYGLAIGAKAINPVNGELLPILIADYVLSDYGTGAVMGVPAHDQRDFDFAKQYDLTIKVVIKPKTDERITNTAFTENGFLTNSGIFTGLDSEEAKCKITQKGLKENWAKEKVTYRLRDWLISRQRYWGCPIPIIHCDKCGPVKVKKQDLPVLLPERIKITSNKISTLVDEKEWLNTPCPKCGETSKRETDTMDTFMCSSWYFLRFSDPNNTSLPFKKDLVDKWLPVNQYVGGIEHAILHLLYARFLTKALFKRGLIGIKEPFERLLTQGMVQAITYRNPNTGKYIPVSKVINHNSPKDPDTNDQLDVLYEKMSKSKYNGVDPKIVIDKYGADTARMFILFKAPPEKDLEWDDADVEGQYRFIQRLVKIVNRYKVIHPNESIKNYMNDSYTFSSATEKEKELRRAVHIAIQEITQDITKDLQLNTAISELMKLSNSISELIGSVSPSLATESISVLIKLLAPFAPHIAEEFWMIAGGEGTVHKQTWPKVDKQALLQDSYELVIQVKGKVRGKIEVPSESTKNDLQEIALKSNIAQKWLEGNQPKRIIIVPGKLVNLVP